MPPSPRPILREHEISSLHDRVAGEAALGVVALRRLVRERAGREGVGGGVVGEHGPSPSAAVGEALAVLLHEVDVLLGARHRRVREVLVLCRLPMDLRHLGAVGEGLAVAGNAGLVASIITGLARITATALSFWLVETTCQPSYPLKEEKASPPGTCKAYLSCWARAMPPKAASPTPSATEATRTRREEKGF